MSLMGERKMSMHVYLYEHSPESGVRYPHRRAGSDWAVSCWSKDFNGRAFFDRFEDAKAYAISHLREHGPGDLVVHIDGQVFETRFIERYEDIPASRAPRHRPSGLAERVAA